MPLNQQQLTNDILQAFTITAGVYYVAQAVSQAIANFVSNATVVGDTSSSAVLLGLNGNVNIYNFTDSITSVPYGSSLTSLPLTMQGSTQGQIFSNVQQNGLSANMTQFRGRLV